MKKNHTAQIPGQTEQLNRADDGRCSALTAKGKPCTNRAKKGSDKCGAHGGNAGKPTITPKSPYGKDVEGEDKTYGEAVLDHIRTGIKNWKAATLVGVAPATVESWIERGEADARDCKPTEFVEFVAGLRSALLQLEAAALDTLSRAIRSSEEKLGDPKIALQVLERLDPAGWSPTHKHEIDANVNIVEQHADQLVEALIPMLEELGVVNDPRVPDLIEKHFSPLERDG